MVRCCPSASAVACRLLLRSRSGAPRCAGPGCRAVHRAVGRSSLTRRLDPGGLPSLAQHGQAGCAGGVHGGGPFPWPGSRVLMSVAPRPTVPLDELARCSRTALRSTALRFASCAAHVPDRRPGHPPCPEPGPPEMRDVLGPARPPRQSLPFGSLVARRSQGRRSSWSWAGRSRSRRAGCAVTPAAVAWARGDACRSLRRISPPRSPHGAPVNG